MCCFLCAAQSLENAKKNDYSAQFIIIALFLLFSLLFVFFVLVFVLLHKALLHFVSNSSSSSSSAAAAAISLLVCLLVCLLHTALLHFLSIMIMCDYVFNLVALLWWFVLVVVVAFRCVIFLSFFVQAILWDLIGLF